MWRAVGGGGGRCGVVAVAAAAVVAAVVAVGFWVLNLECFTCFGVPLGWGAIRLLRAALPGSCHGVPIQGGPAAPIQVAVAAAAAAAAVWWWP